MKFDQFEQAKLASEKQVAELENEKRIADRKRESKRVQESPREYSSYCRVYNERGIAREIQDAAREKDIHRKKTNREIFP